MSQSQPSDREREEHESRSATGATAEAISEYSEEDSETTVQAVTVKLGPRWLKKVKTTVAEAFGALDEDSGDERVTVGNRR